MTAGTKIIINVDTDKLNEAIESIVGTDDFNISEEGIVILEQSKDNLSIGIRGFITGFALNEISGQSGRSFELIADEGTNHGWIVPQLVIEEKV